MKELTRSEWRKKPNEYKGLLMGSDGIKRPAMLSLEPEGTCIVQVKLIPDRYTCWGPDSGQCGKRHRGRRQALDCIRAHAANARIDRRAGGPAPDRLPYLIAGDGRLLSVNLLHRPKDKEGRTVELTFQPRRKRT